MIGDDMQNVRLTMSQYRIVNSVGFKSKGLVVPALFPGKSPRPLPDSRTGITDQSRAQLSRLRTLHTFQQPQGINPELFVGIGEKRGLQCRQRLDSLAAH